MVRTAVGQVKPCDWCGARRVVAFDGDIEVRNERVPARLCGPCVRRDAVVLGVSDDFSRPVQGVLL